MFFSVPAWGGGRGFLCWNCFHSRGHVPFMVTFRSASPWSPTVTFQFVVVIFWKRFIKEFGCVRSSGTSLGLDDVYSLQQAQVLENSMPPSIVESMSGCLQMRDRSIFKQGKLIKKEIGNLLDFTVLAISSHAELWRKHLSTPTWMRIQPLTGYRWDNDKRF